MLISWIAPICWLSFSASIAAQFVPSKPYYTIGVIGRPRDDLFVDWLMRKVNETFGMNITTKTTQLFTANLFAQVDAKAVDFVYTVPTQLSCLMSEFDFTPIATRVAIRQGLPVLEYGSIIYTKKDRDDINTIQDVRGKRILASSITGTGACQIPWQELEKNGISMMMEAGQVLFAGGLQAVADGLRDGYGDVAFGTMTVFDEIENHSASDYKVLGQRYTHPATGEDYPFVVSTDLYPEWTLGAAPWVEPEVFHAIAQTLMMHPDDAIMAETGLAGFVAPVSQTVTRDLQISIGTMSWDPGRKRHVCLRATELYDAITCPTGAYKLSRQDVAEACENAGFPCPASYQGCICQPCKQAAEVEVYQLFDNNTLGAPCSKMSVCAFAVQLEPIRMQVTDYAFRGTGELEVTFHKRKGPQTIMGKRGEKEGTFIFTFSDQFEGNVLVEIAYGNQQLLSSPFFITVDMRTCLDDGFVAGTDGVCQCESGTTKISGECVQIWVLIIAVIIPVILLLGCLIYWWMQWYKKKADGLWLIPFKDIVFPEPVQVLGRGSFGMVIKATYRGTVVAVKRAIPKDTAAERAKDTAKLFDGVETSNITRLSICMPADLQERLSSNEELPLVPTGPHANGSTGNGQSAGSDAAGSGLIQIPAQFGVGAAGSRVSGGISNGLMPPTSQSGGRSFGGGSGDLLDRDKAQGSRPGAGPAGGSMWGNSRRSPKTSRAFQSVVGSTAIGRMALERRDRNTMLQRFVEEMRFLSKLRHPCITTVMGAVVEKNVEPMLVMELMTHGSLFDLINNNTIQLEAEMILPILTDVVQGMRFLHSAATPVLHGDLKAQNILVDSNFRAKVTDFGLTQKKEMGLIGTPYWMPPEVLRGGKPSMEADVYAFGVVLYQATSRKEPYEDEEYSKVMEDILNDDLIPPKTPGVPANCPPTIAGMMAQCWSRSPAARPSFEELDATISKLDLTNVTSTALQRIKQQNEAAEGANAVLFDVFPKHVAEALVRGQQPEPDEREVVTIFFSDIVGFTTISSTVHPSKVSNMLHRLYTCFDQLSVEHDVFKVETIGDAYMAVTNLVKDQENDHAARIARFAIDAVAAANETPIDQDDASMGTVQIRVGFHSGPCVAHVVGLKNPRYCLFGDTVNTASRMESNSVAGRIHCSATAARHVRRQAPHDIRIESRGIIEVKGKGKMNTYWVRARIPGELSSRKDHAASYRNGEQKMGMFGAAGAGDSQLDIARVSSGDSANHVARVSSNDSSAIHDGEGLSHRGTFRQRNQRIPGSGGETISNTPQPDVMGAAVLSPPPDRPADLASEEGGEAQAGAAEQQHGAGAQEGQGADAVVLSQPGVLAEVSARAT